MNNQNKKPVWRDGQGKATGAVRHLDYTLLNYLRQLPTGKRALMRDLAAWRGVSEREIRKRVEHLRRAGYPVCSSVDPKHGGYWWGGDSEADRKATARVFWLRAMNTVIQAKRLESFNEHTARQLGLFDEQGG
ncbi:MAG: hypothetical protein ACOYXO_09845 [Chloroflexota bacterium]